MTRINAGMRPIELCDKHNAGERFEITRVPNSILNRWKTSGKKPNMAGIPAKFKLQTGHVKFFYNKVKYLHRRYDALTQEELNRGHNVNYDPSPFLELQKTFPELYNDWQETPEARAILVDRLYTRIRTLKTTPKWTPHIAEGLDKYSDIDFQKMSREDAAKAEDCRVYNFLIPGQDDSTGFLIPYNQRYQFQELFSMLRRDGFINYQSTIYYEKLLYLEAKYPEVSLLILEKMLLLNRLDDFYLNHSLIELQTKIEKAFNLHDTAV